jgi:2-hydroxychromene-2-carboxylate isomerase
MDRKDAGGDAQQRCASPRGRREPGPGSTRMRPYLRGRPLVVAVPIAATEEQPIFYYDLGDPECYLVAERIMSALPVAPEWEPLLAADLGMIDPSPDRALIERRAAELGIQPLRWPERWPPDTSQAMLAATYAKRIGRAVAFSLAAFRQAFAGGRDLGEEDTVLIAGAACEVHPSALLKGVALRSVGEALAGAVARARLAGVTSLPAIQVADTVFEGTDGLEAAAAALGALR